MSLGPFLVFFVIVVVVLFCFGKEKNVETVRKFTALKVEDRVCVTVLSVSSRNESTQSMFAVDVHQQFVTVR